MVRITRLIELKREYSEHITTSGNNYIIDGIGIYKQVNTFFGLETFEKVNDGSWTRTSFDELAKYVKQIYG